MSNQTVLVIGAHPDDEVLGVGGTMRAHAEDGDEVHVLIVTEGTTAQYDDESVIEQKRREAKRCADRLGVDSVRFGELPDMRLDAIDHIDVNGVVEEAVDNLSPDVVYTHSASEVNQDHLAVHESTMVATRPPSSVGTVYTYEVPSSTEWVGGDAPRFSPNTYVDVTAHLDVKVEAFDAYESEQRSYPHPRSERAIRARAHTRGTESGFEAAEAFSLVRDRRASPPSGSSTTTH